MLRSFSGGSPTLTLIPPALVPPPPTSPQPKKNVGSIAAFEVQDRVRKLQNEVEQMKQHLQAQVGMGGEGPMGVGG